MSLIGQNGWETKQTQKPEDAREWDLQAIRVIALDIDDTLLDFTACAWQSMQQGFDLWNLPLQPDDLDCFLSVNNALWAQIEQGTLSMDELRAVRWQRIFEKMGLRADGPAFEEVFRRFLYHSHVPVPGALEAVERLKTRYPLYIVSNGEHQQQINRLSLAGLMPAFQGLFSSEALGAKKPDPRFFAGCLEQMQKDLPDLQPKNVLIIGDSLEADMKGGQQAGWQTLRFDKETGWPALLQQLGLEQDPPVQ